METWDGGGLGRAQGGYDEMVFRAMVRDGTPPSTIRLRWCRKARKSIPGGRERVSLRHAVHELPGACSTDPEKLQSTGALEPTDRRVITPTDFARVYGKPLDQAWRIGFAGSTNSSRRTSRRARTPDHAAQRHRAPRTRRDFPRAPVSPTQDALRRRALSRTRAAPGRHFAGRRIVRRSSPRSRARFRIALRRWPMTRRRQTLFYTTDNRDYRNLMAYDLKAGKSRTLLKAARIGDLVFNPTTARCGACAPTTAS